MENSERRDSPGGLISCGVSKLFISSYKKSSTPTFRISLAPYSLGIRESTIRRSAKGEKAILFLYKKILFARLDI